MDLNGLRHRDRTRAVHNLTLLASPNSFWFYFTKVKIASPPREFNLIVDTGSYLTWVSCKPCDGCPTYNNFREVMDLTYAGFMLLLFPLYAFPVTLKLERVPPVGMDLNRIRHRDRARGVVNLTLLGSPNSFGRSNILFGRLAESGTAVDGILGLDPGNISIFSQLSSRGIIPKVFSHCLRGDNDGSTLVLGEIQEPGIIYSPLVPSRPLYNLNLQSIAINGNVEQIDPPMFQSGRGTIVDSGTTLSFLAEMAYDPFIDSLTVVVSRFTRPNLIESFQCFQVSDRACSER